MTRTTFAAVAICLAAAAATASADTLTLRNGTRVQGRVIAFADDTLTFRNEDGFAKNYRLDEVETLSFLPAGRDLGHEARQQDGLEARRRDAPDGRRQDAVDARPARRRVGIDAPAGTELVVRTVEMIDSRNVALGQTFAAIIEQNVTDAAGQVIIPIGSSAQLVIREMASRGATGNPEMALDLQSITVNGLRYAVSTTDLGVDSDTGIGANKRTAEAVGGGALLGTVIGAAGGAGAQVLTRGRDVHVPAETVLHFRLDKAARLQSL